MQPASQEHAPGDGGFVGMGSSTGAGAVGLLTGWEVPSGGRRSRFTLRGVGATLSPASRAKDA